MRSAYLQCVGGVSGDMLLGATIDAGVPVGSLNDAISTLGVSGVRIVAKQATRGGVHGTHAIVDVDDASRRSYRLEDFIRITELSSLPDSVKERSTAIFRRLRKAEQQVHRQTEREPHLGELGSVDTLVDVVCTVVGLETLGIDRLYCSPLPTGSGVIKTSHGALPVPAPATSALFELARVLRSAAARRHPGRGGNGDSHRGRHRDHACRVLSALSQRRKDRIRAWHTQSDCLPKRVGHPNRPGVRRPSRHLPEPLGNQRRRLDPGESSHTRKSGSSRSARGTSGSLPFR